MIRLPIADCRLPIGSKRAVGAIQAETCVNDTNTNWQLAIGNWKCS